MHVILVHSDARAYPNGIPEVYLQWRLQRKLLVREGFLSVSLGPRPGELMSVQIAAGGGLLSPAHDSRYAAYCTDWTYHSHVTFVVHLPRCSKGRFAGAPGRRRGARTPQPVAEQARPQRAHRQVQGRAVPHPRSRAQEIQRRERAVRGAGQAALQTGCELLLYEFLIWWHVFTECDSVCRWGLKAPWPWSSLKADTSSRVRCCRQCSLNFI